MTSPSVQNVTKLLRAWRDGEDLALAELLPLVHQELRRIARCYMVGEKHGHTLQATALETAEVLKVSPDTIFRDWKLAETWLAREMGKIEASGAGNDA